MKQDLQNKTNFYTQTEENEFKNRGVWIIEWKTYSAMNQKFALVKGMILKRLSSAIQMKHIKMIAWRKVNFPSQW